jgi:flagellar hook-associated protein 3 FlgL
MNSTQALQNTDDLANLTTVDMASAISQFTLTQTALSAAQKSFAAAQGLSLFNVINP